MLFGNKFGLNLKKERGRSDSNKKSCTATTFFQVTSQENNNGHTTFTATPLPAGAAFNKKLLSKEWHSHAWLHLGIG